jgi:hypothetical protein
MPDRKWLVPTVAGLALAFVLGQAFLPFANAFSSARLDCAAREDCDPDRFTPDTVMDSYLLPGPRSLSDFDRSLDSAIEEHSGIVSEIDEVQATRPATGAERDRLTRFFDLPQACVSLLMTDKRRRAGAASGLHQSND